MQIFIPQTEKHDGVIVTDSFLFFIIMRLIRRFTKCKNSQKPTISSQDLYWNSPDEEKSHSGFYV